MDTECFKGEEASEQIINRTKSIQIPAITATHDQLDQQIKFTRSPITEDHLSKNGLFRVFSEH